MNEEEKEQAVLEQLNSIDCACSCLRHSNDKEECRAAANEVVTATKRIYEIRFGDVSEAQEA